MRQRLNTLKTRWGQTLTGLTLLVLCCVPFPAQAVQLVDPPSTAALAGRVQLALESFQILDAYPDRTFQGQRAFTRYELADALGRSVNYLQRRYALKLADQAILDRVIQVYLRPDGDIPARHWAYPALEQVLGYGLMTGKDMQFQGGSKVSRFLLAQTLNQLLEWLQVTPVKMKTQTPVDVPSEHWAAEAVSKLVDAGIFELDATGHFEGERQATRYELAETLVKLLQQVDLVAQQRPLETQHIIPDVLQKTPAGRMPRHRHH